MNALCQDNATIITSCFLLHYSVVPRGLVCCQSILSTTKRIHAVGSSSESNGIVIVLQFNVNLIFILILISKSLL